MLNAICPLSIRIRNFRNFRNLQKKSYKNHHIIHYGFARYSARFRNEIRNVGCGVARRFNFHYGMHYGFFQFRNA